jgi:DNA (cytosine-5)-methyltransferase 1
MIRAVDLFAGFGGFTEGAEQAGARVVWAGNHWPLAVAVHQRNHLEARHVCQDLRQADWSGLPAFELLLGAPACQGHSTASQPKRRGYHDAMRATAWSIVDCADVTHPKALIVENVMAFRRWRLYPTWRAALETLGYQLTELQVNAARHGVAQRRTRLFIVGLRSRRPFHFASPLKPEPAFETCLETPDPGGWKPIASATPGARDRMRAAQKRSGRRCLVQHTTGHVGVPLDQAIRTITTKDHWVLVSGDAYRKLTNRELARGMGFPDSYELPDAPRVHVCMGLGNAVSPPVARDLITAVEEAA